MTPATRFVLLALVCCAIPASAAERAPLTVSTRTTRTALQVRVVVDEGHHLAVDFPARLGIRTIPETGLEDELDLRGRVSELADGVEMALPSERPIVVDGELEVGVCDDAGTCQPYTLGFQVAVERRASTAYTPAEMMAIQPILEGRGAQPQAAPQGISTATWIRDDLDAALQQAARREAPLLLVFKARWCPPCNQLWSEVLSSQEHAVILEPYVRAAFDADLPASWQAKSRYEVGGYPTTVICRPDGEVLARIEGYQGADPWLERVLAATAEMQPLDALVARAHGSADPASGAYDPELALVIAHRFAQRKDRASAAEWSGRVLAVTDLDLDTWAEVAAFVAIEDPDPAAGAAALQALLLDQAVQPSVQPLQQMWWWTEVADLATRAGDADGASLAWQRARSTAEHLLSGLPEVGTAAEAWYGLALAADGLGESAAAIEAWSAAADSYLAQVGDGADAARLLAQRGNVLSAAGCLRRAGRVPEAMTLLDVAIDGAPDEPSLYLSRARVAGAGEALAEQALADAGTAWRLAEGDLRLKAADTWSALLLDAERADEARDMLEQTLAGLVLPDDAGIRTHRYHAALQARLVEIGAE